MIEMISKTRHEYGGKMIEPKEKFNVEEGHVQLLTAMGRAELPKEGSYETRNLEAGANATAGAYHTRVVANRTKVRGREN